MSEEKFDAIIVGGGIAGTVASYLLAKEGLDVVLIERGNYCGSKNMTGGRIYGHSIEKIFPHFAEEAPIERKITREKISLMTGESNFTIDFSSSELGRQGGDSYSVLRGAFDQWLAGKAEKAGVNIITGIRVDNLIIHNGAVSGVVAGEDELESDVTILADGVNSLLAQKLGFCEELRANQVAIGVKEVIELPAHVIEDRFQCSGKEGTAWLFAGYPSGGRIGGGFLYTNQSSLSLGIVCTLDDVIKGEKSVPQLLEDFKKHPVIQPLIKNGKLLEYSGHLVPEGGLNSIPKIVGNGVLVVGDAAGFCINLGYAVRGMDFAVASAECAAKAVLKAKESQNFREESLNGYHDNLERSFVMKDLRLYKKFPHFLEKTPRIFKEYPQMVENLMNDLFIMNGQPAKPLTKKIVNNMKKVGILNIVKDCWRGVRSL
ncbi:FAD-dependent oxidoreductase [Sporolactobacillus sp. KGMB 08714]|uniref:FAD-dependent oxidoreductase n=1 Tax=Sporolactobacillus sp. KGMB 08714 TaxID=3064704 RepID=UPI002FBD33C6